MVNKTFTETMGYLEAKGFLTPLDEKRGGAEMSKPECHGDYKMKPICQSCDWSFSCFAKDWKRMFPVTEV